MTLARSTCGVVCCVEVNVCVIVRGWENKGGCIITSIHRHTYTHLHTFISTLLDAYPTNKKIAKIGTTKMNPSTGETSTETIICVCVC